MQAYETTARIDSTGQLHLDKPLLVRNRRARIVVLVEESSEVTEWMQSAATNPSFDFLHHLEEDIYTAEDGTPTR